MQVESIKATGGSQGADATRPLSTELQVLTSRPVLDAAARTLSASASATLAAPGTDAVAAMQSALEARLAGGTDVVELVAIGPDAAFVAELVNAVVGAYKERLEASHRESSDESLAEIADKVVKLEAEVLVKRRAVEAFRVRHGVVSPERDENQVLTRRRGLGASLNVANEKLADAEGRYRSLQEAVAEGRSVVRARDNPTLANLEQRISQIREELRELERTYTPDYLALDNRARAQRARLAELEQQVSMLRKQSQEDTLAEAQEAVAAARATVDRIERQIASDQGAVRSFTARFSEYKELLEDLGRSSRSIAMP